VNRRTRGNKAGGPDAGATAVLFWSATALLALLSCALVLVATSGNGIGLSPDSVGYIGLARGILQDGFAFLWEPVAVKHPPVYPLLLAGPALLLGRDPLAVARFAGAIGSALLIAVVMLSVRRLRVPLWINAAIGFLACGSVALNEINTMAWTELPFTLAAYTAFLVALSRESTIRRNLLLAALAGAACLTRYPAIVLIPLLTLHTLLFTPGGWGNRLRNGAVFSVPASLPFVVYAGRNHALTGTLLGSWAPSQRGFFQNAGLAANVLGDWFLPPESAAVSVLTLVLLLVVLAGGLTGALRRPAPPGSANRGSALLLYLGFAAAHLSFMLVTASTTHFDRIDHRLLSPALPALLILLALAAGALSSSWADTRARRLAAAVVIAALLVLLALPPAGHVPGQVARYRERGIGFQKDSFRLSPLVGFFRSGKGDTLHPLYSNADDVLYILAGACSRRSAPWDGPPGALLAMDDAYLAWFGAVRFRPYLLAPEEFPPRCRLRTVARFPDGAVYHVRCPGGPASSGKRRDRAVSGSRGGPGTDCHSTFIP